MKGVRCNELLGGIALKNYVCFSLKMSASSDEIPVISHHSNSIHKIKV